METKKGGWTSIVLIPYLQGSLFRLKALNIELTSFGLNPLSTGKSVQTVPKKQITSLSGLNPLSTGKSVQTEWMCNEHPDTVS